MARPVQRGRGGTTAVGELIPLILDELGLGRANLGVRVVRAWDEAVGPRFAPHCRPHALRGGVLHAHVRDSAWMQRVSLERREILARLERALGEPVATDLRLRIGPLA